MARDPIIPPAPKIHARDLPLLPFLAKIIHSTLDIWPEHAFEDMFARERRLGISAFLINDPMEARRMLGPNSANYRRPPVVTRVTRPIGGNGLFLAEGAEWRRQRKILAPPFAPAQLNVLTPHFHEAARHLIQRLENAPTVNLSHAFQEGALDAVLRALFSLPDPQARESLAKIARDFASGPGRPNLFDGIARKEESFAFLSGGRRRFARMWSAAIDALIAARMSADAGGRGDLLDLLLALRAPEGGEGLSLTDIRDQCATMLFAGSETTARLLFWTCYLLTLDAQEQERVRAEVRAFTPERALTIEDLKNWPALRNLLLEALRLYPPAPHLVRDAIGPDEICGQKVAAGTQVWVSAWVMHRHRKFWDRPTAFMPDRFEGVLAPWTQIPAFIPFGAGPRICIGLNFALAEAQIVLAHLLARFELRLDDPRPVMPIGRFTTVPSHEPNFRLEAVP